MGLHCFCTQTQKHVSEKQNIAFARSKPQPQSACHSATFKRPLSDNFKQDMFQWSQYLQVVYQLSIQSINWSLRLKQTLSTLRAFNIDLLF